MNSEIMRLRELKACPYVVQGLDPRLRYPFIAIRNNNLSNEYSLSRNFAKSERSDGDLRITSNVSIETWRYLWEYTGRKGRLEAADLGDWQIGEIGEIGKVHSS